MERLHATCVALNGKGVLITGPSGCGKSDLALRLLERGARLVADDQVEVTLENGVLTATSPASIKGLIEARYVGPLKVPAMAAAPLALVLEPGIPERLPEPQVRQIMGIPLPLLVLPYLEASTPIKIKLFLEQ